VPSSRKTPPKSRARKSAAAREFAPFSGNEQQVVEIHCCFAARAESSRPKCPSNHAAFGTNSPAAATQRAPQPTSRTLSVGASRIFSSTGSVMGR